MNKGPDYTKYSIEELYQVYNSIDKDAFPERVKTILNEIEKRNNNSPDKPKKEAENNETTVVEKEISAIHPSSISEKKINPYAGFWLRAGSLVVDLLILIPYGFLVFYLQKTNYLFFLCFAFLGIGFNFFWSIYLLKRFGGTPDKLICGIKVIRTNGAAVDWKAAVFRNIIDFPFAIYLSFFSLWIIPNIGYETFQEMTMIEYGQFLNQKGPAFHNIINYVFQFWFWGELLVLLFNKRKRAIHDFIAGTVVIKKDFESDIKQYVDSSDNS